jgi:hypothetical protein
MNTPTPTLEQMINMKLDERTNENKQMDNILSNIQKHGNNGNYNKQAQEDIQDDELQMYRMQSMAMQNMAMQNMAMQNMDGPNIGGQNMGGQNMSGQNMGGPNMGGPNMGGPNMGMPMQNMGMPLQNMGMPMQNMGMPMQNMGGSMQNMGMPMQNMGMGAGVGVGGQMQKKHEINDLENLKTKKVISYIKNPLIVFIIFIVLNSSIIIQTIDNLLGFCNNASIISIINLIIRGLIGSLLYIIFTNILINV